MLIEAKASDFAALLAGRGPENLRLVEDIAPLEVLAMLAMLADSIRGAFAPAAWMIVEDGAVAGLCSLVKPPADGTIEIGYGVAPGFRGRGIARRAVGDVVAWAANDPRIDRVAAEAAIHNLPSQRVLEANGFSRTGERTDPEDGPVGMWVLQL